MNKVHVISFDGLNRSGKGTQIKNLEECLIQKNLPSLIIRGDGSRKGNESQNDEYSAWWQEIQPRLREVNSQGEFNSDVWEKASNQINLELYQAYNNELPKRIKESGGKEGYLILDRSIISKYYMAKRENPGIKLEDVLEFETPDKKKEKLILPDISFVLHVPREVLLERNDYLSDHPDKYDFRKRVISQYYDDFEKTTLELKTPLLKIYHLDGNRQKEQIFNDVIKYLTEVVKNV